eukprot:TRINITY_DN1983_c0_g1_i2.p1 TRINITY_DN1983_c0_g1~~TRINITY_DN1983_c0_g1_i2.p1  ORF type:complete len:225 (-),score=32.34 TRINITY_DN1983_c0_g1_i2:72-746(-)
MSAQERRFKYRSVVGSTPPKNDTLETLHFRYQIASNGGEAMFVQNVLCKPQFDKIEKCFANGEKVCAKEHLAADLCGSRFFRPDLYTRWAESTSESDVQRERRYNLAAYTARSDFLDNKRHYYQWKAAPLNKTYTAPEYSAKQDCKAPGRTETGDLDEECVIPKVCPAEHEAFKACLKNGKLSSCADSGSAVMECFGSFVLKHRILNALDEEVAARRQANEANK